MRLGNEDEPPVLQLSVPKQAVCGEEAREPRGFMFTERAFGLAMETRSQVLEGEFSLGKGSYPAELVRRDVVVPATPGTCTVKGLRCQDGSRTTHRGRPLGRGTTVLQLICFGC